MGRATVPAASLAGLALVGCGNLASRSSHPMPSGSPPLTPVIDALAALIQEYGA